MQTGLTAARRARALAVIPALVGGSFLPQLVLAQGRGVVAATASSYREHAAPTYTKDVAPILFANCTTCHRPGGLGPMSLMSYDGAKRSATKIRAAVETGKMPPWHADAPRGHFLNDRRLTDADKATILAWVDAGTPEGNPRDLPAAPVYPDAWTAGKPDVVFAMPTEFEVPARGKIEYQYFEVPTNFTEEKWISALEVLPGARKSVHHVLVFAREPKPDAPPADKPTAAPGRNRGPLLRFNPNHFPPPSPKGSEPKEPQRDMGSLIGGTAPGTNVVTFTDGRALRVAPGTVLTFQMHYTAHGHAEKDRTSIGLTFAKGAVTDTVHNTAIMNQMFTLPAGAKDVAVAAEMTVRDTVRIWGLLPHTHLRGVRWEYTLEYPDGRLEKVLSVPRYDFNWQTYYMFTNPLVMPAGSTLRTVAWYDNSAGNKNNPDATIDVKWGEQTWEEMQFTSFFYSAGSGKGKPGKQAAATGGTQR